RRRVLADRCERESAPDRTLPGARRLMRRGREHRVVGRRRVLALSVTSFAAANPYNGVHVIDIDTGPGDGFAHSDALWKPLMPRRFTTPRDDRLRSVSVASGPAI